MNSNRVRLWLCICLCFVCQQNSDAVEYKSSGIADIDQVRQEVKVSPTTVESARLRRATLYRWWRLLWRQGCDLRFLDATAAALISSKDDTKAGCEAIDRGFAQLEAFLANPGFIPEIKGVLAPAGKETSWPQFHGIDGTQRGYSPDVGPSQGRLAWRFPKGYTWNARPVLQDGKIYLASPGIDVFGYCLDEASGRVLWKARQYGIQFYSAYGSRWDPVLTEERVTFQTGHREVKLFVVDKRTGAMLESQQATGRQDVMVYKQNGQCVILAHAQTGEELWRYHAQAYLAGEPLLSGDKVYVALENGIVLCLSSRNKEQLWQHDMGVTLRGCTSLGSRHLLVGSVDSQLYALNPSNGRLNWSYQSQERENRAYQFYSGVVETGQRVYVGAASGFVYCLDARQGTLIWKHRVSDWVRARPLVLGDLVYVATLDSQLFALQDRGDTCAEIWRKRLGTHGFTADLVGNKQSILASGRDLILYSVALDTGRIQWHHGILDGTWVKERFVAADWTGGLMASPTVVDGKVYIGGPDGFVNAVETQTGRELWRFETKGTVSIAPRVAEGKVFFGHLGGTSEHYTLDVPGRYYAVDKDTGEPVWQSSEYGMVWVGAAYAQGRLFFGNMDGTFYGVDAATGKELWSYYTGKNTPLEQLPLDGSFRHGFPPGVYCCPVVDDTKVYTGSWSGYYFAFDQRSGKVLWRTATNNGNLHGGLPDSAAPVLWKDHLYVQKLGHCLVALNKDTGKLSWQWRGRAGFLQNGTIAAHGDRIFGSICRHVTMLPYNATVLAFRDVGHGGAPLWEYRGGCGLTTPVLAQDKLIFGSSCDPFLTCLDPESGTVKWRFYTGGEMLENSPALYGNKVFVHCKNGWLFAVE